MNITKPKNVTNFETQTVVKKLLAFDRLTLAEIKNKDLKIRKTHKASKPFHE